MLRHFFAMAALALLASPATAQSRYAVIDMHFHADLPDAEGPPGGKICAPYPSFAAHDPGQPIAHQIDWVSGHPPCPHPFVAPTDPAELRDKGLAALRRHNVLALAGGAAATVADYRAHAPDRILPAAGFGSDGVLPSIASLRALHKAGKLTALSEIAAQYAGIAPDDPRLEPYYALAEELDIPVGLHLGPGPPGIIYWASPAMRAAQGDPMRLESVLTRHPRLRLYAMHAGWPLADAMIAVMYAHPQLYVDIGIIDYAYPERGFYDYLKRLIDAGFEDRIMFGSDNMVWPDAIGAAIERIRRAPFLSERQRRLILHDNAARFLRIRG